MQWVAEQCLLYLFSLEIQDDEEAYGRHADDGDAQSDVIQEAIRNDELRRLEQAERSSAESAILLAAKIIAARISNSCEDAYNWCIEQVYYLRYRTSRTRVLHLFIFII